MKTFFVEILYELWKFSNENKQNPGNCAKSDLVLIKTDIYPLMALQNKLIK